MLITMDGFNVKKKPKIFVADEKQFISNSSKKKKKSPKKTCNKFKKKVKTMSVDENSIIACDQNFHMKLYKLSLLYIYIYIGES